MTVLASEPRAGRFRFIELALGVARVPVWMHLHVLSSIATTAVVCWMVSGIRERPHRDRVIAALGGVLLIGGSALGFLYTRDRIGLAAGIGYAMLVYVALSALLARPAARWQSTAAMTLVAILAICWSIRTAETVVSLRETAWDYYLEWDREEARTASTQSPTIAQLRSSATKHRPADPRARSGVDVPPLRTAIRAGIGDTVTLRIAFASLLLAGLGAVATSAQRAGGAPAAPPLVRENATEKISAHVYVIPDNSVSMVPNIGIIVGTRGTLVVDTGLGARNGQTVVREVQKVSKTPELYLATTHFHPEHDLGAGGFPAHTKMIRSQDQQKEIAEQGAATTEGSAVSAP